MGENDITHDLAEKNENMIDRWLSFKDGIVELVNRSSFKRLELIISQNANCDDLLFTIETNANLRLKLKALILYSNIHRPLLNWRVKPKNPSLLMSNEYFLRLLNVTQGLEEFSFNIFRENTPTGSGCINNQTKDEEYPALFTNFNPKKMKILSYICNVPCQYTLMPILQKCGSTLKHLQIFNWRGLPGYYPIDEILSICPNLLTFDAVCGLEIGKNCEAGESSDQKSSSSHTKIISRIYPLRSIRYSNYCKYKEVAVEAWLRVHCPNVKRHQNAIGSIHNYDYQSDL